MKLLFLSHYYPPEGNAPASRVHAMCRRWAADGHDVDVLTCAPNVPSGVVYEGYRNRWYQREMMDRVQVHRGWTFLAANRGFARRIVNYLSYFAMALVHALRIQRPDLVIATSPQFFCGWAGVWVARMFRRPLVLEIRDIWPESISAVTTDDGPATGSRGLKTMAAAGVTRYLEWLERRMYQAATHIVTVGEGYRKKLLERGVPRSKISVISNGVETDLFSPREPSPELRAQAGAGPQDLLVGYIGTVGMAHGLETVIEAGRIARDRGLDRLRFVVVGDGAQRESLVEELERDDPGNVRFMGRRPKAEMPEWLASVDACLVHLRDLPLFETVMPSKMFEAFAMERPVLLGVRGEARKLLAKAGGGWAFEPGNAAQLVDLAARADADRRQLRNMGQRGRREVLREFTLDELAARYAAVLAEIQHRGPTRTRVHEGPSSRPGAHADR